MYNSLNYNENDALIKKKQSRNKLYRKICIYVTITVALCVFLYLVSYITKTIIYKNKIPPYESKNNSTLKFRDIVSTLKETYCPYNGLSGLSPQCLPQQSRKKDTLPLSVLIGTGWDPITGQIKLPFFQMSYTHNKYYISNTGKKYYIPDEVVLSKTNLSHHNIVTNIYNTIDQYLNNIDPNRTTVYSGTLGLPINDIPNFLHFFDYGQSVISSVTEYRSNFNLDLNGEQIIIPSVQQAINSLPKIYDATIYNMFIQYWGTSVVLSGVSGGLGQQTVMMKKCFGGIDFSSQSELYMLKQFYEKQYSNINFAAKFQQYSKASIVDMYGGNPQYFDSKEWQKRVDSFDDNPILTRVTVKPITDYIDDPIIKANLFKAIDDYYTTGIEEINKYKTDYYNNIHGPKNVQFIGYTNGYFQGTESKVMAVNQSQLFVILPSFATYCTKDGDGNVISTVDQATVNKINQDGHGIQIATVLQNGSPIWAGCSLNHVQIKMGGVVNFDTLNMCCQNCIPTNDLNNICPCPSF